MNEELFHSLRRAFIIFPEIGIVLLQKEKTFSHKEILQNMGYDKENIKKMIKNYPRGYFKDNELVLYQDDFNQLSKENLNIVKNVFEDFKNLFNLNENTKIYSGVIKGKIGEIWQPDKRIFI
ncbi:MAG: hypothetical protein BWY78_00389 [Alphaproteobacteria bacterium ADurb.Bin438]|nr:MAG: hypothetical protein BWY78_00389 [Alphaproteobacteria bacterium ADurb.Bin438]